MQVFSTGLDLGRGEAETTMDAELSVRIAMNAAGTGIFRLRDDQSELQWSERMRSLFGYAPGTKVTREFLARASP